MMNYINQMPCDKDGINQEKCDESWSMDNLKVRVVKYQ